MIQLNRVEVQILVKGKPVKQYWHNSQWWVEARNGVNYEIKIKNNYGKRILAIASVDGLSVLDGKPASNESDGYIINGYSSYSIKGFRVSDDEVNKFEFATKTESYAAKSPDGEQSTANCGVIAVRIIEEKEKPLLPLLNYRYKSFPEKRPMVPFPRRPISPWYEEPYYLSKISNIGAVGAPYGASADYGTSCVNFSDAQPKQEPANAIVEKGFDMGTKFSDETVEDKVTTAIFERGPMLDEISIYYASKCSLINDFKVPMEVEPQVSLPSGFKDSKYCRPPKK